MMTGKKGRSGYPLFFLLLVLALLPIISPAAEIPCVWTGIDRIVAVADLHGDYEQFTYILAHPGVGLVDEDLHWVGGKAHLVQLGDVMDRGLYAWKIFDLLMRLEKEAAAAGGMVHVLLGNHEEMNITGIAWDYPGYITVEQLLSYLPDDLRMAKEAEYLRTLPPEERKKAESAGLDPSVDEGLASFWQRIINRKDPEVRRAYIMGFNETHGDWLIKKNIVIKINGVVYAHGGISEEFSKWPLPQLNNVMRQELDLFQGFMRHPDQVIRPFRPEIVYNPNSPLWYRGLGTKSEASAQAEVDRTLANLDAKAMVVGHSFFYFNNRGSSPTVEKTMVARFHDKVWIMDTGISGSYGGLPSALIFDHGEFRLWGETEELAMRSGIKPPPPKPVTHKETETFLRTAEITGRGPGPGGRTDAWRLTLEARGLSLPALFKYVDRRRPNPLPDSYMYDLAAYALDKYLGLGFVPPIVERSVQEIPGALQAFVGNAMSEVERKERQIVPKDPAQFEKSMADLLVFQNLVYDDCQNEKDTLISRDDGRVYRVDLSEAFAPKKGDVPHCTIRRCSRLLYRKLLGWDDKTVARYLGRYLGAEEIEALNTRRKLIVRFIQMQIKAQGEANVLY
jgi:hypothetical protein